ncbi:MAG: hypothetical protein ACKPCM_17410, partial [Pseudanabaena sp.]
TSNQCVSPMGLIFCFQMSTHSFENCNKAYNDYEVEDLLLEAENIQLSAMRKSNSIGLTHWLDVVRAKPAPHLTQT